MKFTDLNLNASLTNALADLNITEPTRIQKEAFSPIMSGKDVIGLAQTGTGKTFAYLLPVLRMHKFSKKQHPTVLIVVPTRELVAQVVEEVEKLTAYMTYRVAGVYGGTNINTQKDVVMAGLDMVVATPGRLVDLALCGALKLKMVQKLIIDEMDEMLELGFRPQVLNILDLIPERRQNLLFSATMTTDIKKIIDPFFNQPMLVEAAAHGTPLDKIDQRGYEVPNFLSKIELLKVLLDDEEMTRVLIFTKNKRWADLCFDQLFEDFEEQMGLIHANKSQNFRFNSLRKFQSGEYRLLIATDVVARGLDLSDITHVVNFDLSDDAPNYMHRIGRTGRADKPGVAISFISPDDDNSKAMVESLMKMEIPMKEVPEDCEFTEELIQEEMPVLPGVEREPRAPRQAVASSGFHEKSEKNSKVNEGGSYRKKIAAKYKKPKTRGQKNQGKKR